MIPVQLQKEEFRFVKIERNTKKPIGYDWTTKNYKFNDQNLLDWLKIEGNSYGVVCGFGGLIVLDFDDLKTQDIVIPY